MPYVLSRQARRDIERMAAKLGRAQGRVVADRMLRRLEHSFDMLGEHPLAGRDRSDDLGPERRSSVSGLCIIVHRSIGRDVLIERVVDGRRDYLPIFQS